jgi:hypothetical protein
LAAVVVEAVGCSRFSIAQLEPLSRAAAQAAQAAQSTLLREFRYLELP